MKYKLPPSLFKKKNPVREIQKKKESFTRPSQPKTQERDMSVKRIKLPKKMSRAVMMSRVKEQLRRKRNK